MFVKWKNAECFFTLEKCSMFFKLEKRRMFFNLKKLRKLLLYKKKCGMLVKSEKNVKDEITSPGPRVCSKALFAMTGLKSIPSCCRVNSFVVNGSSELSSSILITFSWLSSGLTSVSMSLRASMSEIPSSRWNSMSGRISKETEEWIKGWEQLTHWFPLNIFKQVGF